MSDLRSVILDLREARFACIVEKEHINSDTLTFYRAQGGYKIATRFPGEIRSSEDRQRFLETWKSYSGRVLVLIQQDELDALEAFAPRDRFVYTDEGLLRMNYDDDEEE